MARTLVIGDIHGCATALNALLDALNLQKSDTLVTLGDYVDRGMDSAGVIQTLLQWMNQVRLVPLLGNHEIMMMQAMTSTEVMNFWLSHGGQQTLQSYGGSPDKIPSEHLTFLKHCHKFWENDNHFFVHANYLANQPLENLPDQIAFWEHMKTSYPIAHQNGKKAWVGHTPQDSGNILDLGHLAIVDTYCYGDGYLSAVDVDSGDFWQVRMDGTFRDFAAEEEDAD